MKTFIILLSIFLLVNSAFTQELNKVIFDEKAEQEILYGKCNTDGFSLDQFREWHDKEFDGYEVDIATLEAMNEDEFHSLTITIVMGTWCEDSRREVPRFYKILDEYSFDEDNVNLLCVNREKKIMTMDISELDIEFVPTIIFYKNDQEVGRIIETPKESLEKDLLNIINNLH